MTSVAAANKAARPYLADLVETWFPDGEYDKDNADEYKIYGPAFGDIRFNVKKGKFLGDANGHDIVKLAEIAFGLNSADAAQRVMRDIDAIKNPKKKPNGHSNGQTHDEPPLSTFVMRALPPPVRVWFYRDAAGAIVGAAVRHDTPDGKVFRQWRCDNGIWSAKAIDKPRPLYGLDRFGVPGPIVVCEGEKSADAARAIFSLDATTSLGGSKAPQFADWSPLANRDVVIWPDHDEPGAKYAETVARLVTAAGAASVRIVQVPDAWPDGWDLADTPPNGADLKAMLDDAKAQPLWTRMLLRDGNNVVKANVENAVIVITHAPPLEGVVAFDDMTKKVVVTREIGQELLDAPRAFADVDYTRIQRWLLRHAIPSSAREHVIQAIDDVALANAFHPIRNYLDGLEWDRQKRLDTWLIDYVGAKDTPYIRAVGRIVLISMVARIFEPGCKVDYVMVLEGEQGLEKSKLLGVLAGEWFGDHLPSLRDKDTDTSMYLRGKWVIEVSELHTFTRADIEKLKAFITRRVEQYRPPYGRVEVSEPRQGIQIGTTNQETWMRDETGGRRFLPVKAETIDVPGFASARDQLFAEAVHAYRKGEQWWPNRAFELEHFRPEQDKRFQIDVWEDKIRTWLQDQIDDNCVALKKHRPELAKRDGVAFTCSEILQIAVGKNIEHQNIGDAMRVSAILRRLGWQRSNVRGDNGIRLYVPPNAPNPESMTKTRRHVATRLARNRAKRAQS